MAVRALRDDSRERADRFDVLMLEQVRYRGEIYPLLEVRAPKAGPPRLLVLAGVHDEEHAGLLAVPAIRTNPLGDR